MRFAKTYHKQTHIFALNTKADLIVCTNRPVCDIRDETKGLAASPSCIVLRIMANIVDILLTIESYSCSLPRRFSLLSELGQQHDGPCTDYLPLFDDSLHDQADER